MTIKQRHILGGTLLFLAFSALALLFGFYDMAISEAVVNTENTFGRTMELSGMLVAPYLAILAGMTLAVYFLKMKSSSLRWLKMTVGLLFVLAGLIYSAFLYAQMPRPTDTAAWLLTGIGCALAAGWLIRQTTARLYQLMKIAAVTLVHLIAVLAIINLIKLFWGRVRYREMTDPTEFSRWFLPQGITGRHSFPSGHTANAATLYVLTMFAPLTKVRWKKALCYLIPILWILLMAVSRVLIGAHYASDVLFGGSISILLFYLVRHFLTKHIREYAE